MEVAILILIPDLESHICGVGTIFFVDIVHSKYINFPVSKQITKLLCRHGGEQGSLEALETPGAGLAGGAGNKEGSERNLATPAPAAPASPARNIFTIW